MNSSRHDVYALYLPWWGKANAKVLFFMLVGLFAALFFVYVYLVHMTVNNVIARTNAERQIASISGQVGDMESQYLTLDNAITLQTAMDNGFERVEAAQYISRSQNFSYNYSH